MKFKILMCLSLSLLNVDAFAKAAKLNYVPGEILVKYKSSVSANNQKISIEREGHKRLARYNRGLVRVKLVSQTDMKQAILDFKNDPDVEYAQPNYIYKALAVPNDPRYGQLWGLKNTAQTITTAGGKDTPSSTNNPGVAGRDMQAEYAWNTITDCSSVTVAVLDTGINYNNSDLSSNMWNGGGSYPNHGYDYVDNDNDPMDLSGHGTHVAGTIGARGNNGVGSTGVCWRSSLMAVRVLGTTGSGTSAGIVAGIYFAVDNGAKVINMSLGGDSYDAAYSAAIDYAQNHGVLIVAAAGNDGTNNESLPMYPCNFTQANVICVAALTQNYSLASFSNYGTTSVDVGAPGVNIVSTWPGTNASVSDSLTSGWNFTSTAGSPWAYKSLNFGSPTACLVNPSNYNYSSARYVNNNDARAWKAFSISSSVAAATVNFYAMYDLENNADYVTINKKAGSGDPMSGGTVLDSFTGSTDGYALPQEYDLSSHIGSTVSVGFNLLTDSSGTDLGANISVFSIDTLTLNTTSYNVISGTSMAAPHVAGVAAMIFAYNPDYTYEEVAKSIKMGGTAQSSLTGKTVTGRSVSAVGALNYIQAPLGGAANILP
ncbi:subtilase family protein [Bacteriovorax stolpii]|nr:S8 family peptidase [Bacteriovorax stolpii]TDP50869.1 subtilase family protein [Bacteriovorax stolpii]